MSIDVVVTFILLAGFAAWATWSLGRQWAADTREIAAGAAERAERWNEEHLATERSAGTGMVAYTAGGAGGGAGASSRPAVIGGDSVAAGQEVIGG